MPFSLPLVGKDMDKGVHWGQDRAKHFAIFLNWTQALS